MKLTTAHQILIAGAIALGAIYALHSLLMFSRGEGSVELGLAACGVAIAVAGAVYLRRFRQKLVKRGAS